MGYSALMGCAEDLEALDRLLATSPPLEEVDKKGWTALFYAAGRFGGMPRCVERLLRAGANPNHRTHSGESILDVLRAGVNDGSERDTAKVVEGILRRRGFRGEVHWLWRSEGVEVSVEIDRDVLHWVSGGSLQTQRLSELESLGPPYALPEAVEQAIRQRLGLEGPLRWEPDPLKRRFLLACTRDAMSEVRWVISKGVSVDTRDNLGDTALMLALRHRRIQLARVLIEAGADASLVGRGGRTALYWALVGQHPESLIGELLCAGASALCRDSKGRTPLHWAVDIEGADLMSIEWLLTADAAINARDNEGVTPLMLARSERVRRKLLDAGASPG